jgi:hypothetical protein
MHAIRALLITVALLAAAAPAQARETQLPTKEIQLVAYGEGTTICNVTVSMGRIYPHLFFPPYSFQGETNCSAAVQQTGHAWSGDASGNTCSTFGTTCRSGGEVMGAFAVGYDITVTAPRGQGWVALPDDCSGAGTDFLRCHFVVQWV